MTTDKQVIADSEELCDKTLLFIGDSIKVVDRIYPMTNMSVVYINSCTVVTTQLTPV